MNSSFPFEGRVAQALARRRSDVALADLNAAGRAQTATLVQALGVRASTHRLDVSDRAARAALPVAVQAAHGRLGILVNNAGVALGGTFEQVAEAEFEWLFGINFWALVRRTRHELKGRSVGLTVVHPGSVATDIVRSARLPTGTPDTLRVAGLARAQRLQKLAPEQAGGTIVKAIARRAARLLVGHDARAAAFIERRRPVNQWRWLSRRARL